MFNGIVVLFGQFCVIYRQIEARQGSCRVQHRPRPTPTGATCFRVLISFLLKPKFNAHSPQRGEHPSDQRQLDKSWTIRSIFSPGCCSPSLCSVCNWCSQSLPRSCKATLANSTSGSPTRTIGLLRSSRRAVRTQDRAALGCLLHVRLRCF